MRNLIEMKRDVCTKCYKSLITIQRKICPSPMLDGLLKAGVKCRKKKKILRRCRIFDQIAVSWKVFLTSHDEEKEGNVEGIFDDRCVSTSWANNRSVHRSGLLKPPEMHRIKVFFWNHDFSEVGKYAPWMGKDFQFEWVCRPSIHCESVFQYQF